MKPRQTASWPTGGAVDADLLDLRADDDTRAKTIVPQSPTAQAWRRFRKNWVAVASVVILVTLSVAAIFAPFLTHYNPTGIDLKHLVADAPPSRAHWLGTDGVGADLFTRLLYGMRAPLAVSVFGAIACALLGAVIGVVAGLEGGWIDSLLSRVTEFVFVIPGLLLVILCVALFGNVLDGPLGLVGRYVMITIFLATDNWPPIMRLARAEALRLKEMPFTEAARVAGSTTGGIVRRHMLPNMLGIVLVQGALLVPAFIFATATLSIFGLGTPPPNPDIGQNLIDGTGVMDLNPVELIAPCAILTALILTSTFVGDGLRDALDTSA